MKRTLWRIVKFGLAVAFLLIGLFGGGIQYSNLTPSYFKSCPENEIRLGCTSLRDQWDVTGTIDFAKGTYVELRDAKFDHSGNGVVSLSAGQLARIAKIRDSFPRKGSWAAFFGWYDFRNYLYVA